MEHLAGLLAERVRSEVGEPLEGRLDNVESAVKDLRRIGPFFEVSVSGRTIPDRLSTVETLHLELRERVNALEKGETTGRQQVRAEAMKGKWLVITALVTAVLSLLATIAIRFLK